MSLHYFAVAAAAQNRVWTHLLAVLLLQQLLLPRSLNNCIRNNGIQLLRQENVAFAFAVAAPCERTLTALCGMTDVLVFPGSHIYQKILNSLGREYWHMLYEVRVNCQWVLFVLFKGWKTLPNISTRRSSIRFRVFPNNKCMTELSDKRNKEVLFLSAGFNIKHIDLYIYASISYQGTNINRPRISITNFMCFLPL